MTLNCKGKLIDITDPKVMGILNVTPDSFYDGAAYPNDTAILSAVENMLLEGATFIDIGGYSSRPGADEVSLKDELKRVIPTIQLVLKEFPECLISVDTFQSKVAAESIAAGAALINDISAGQLDPNMMQTVGELGVPYIMMHMKGTPKTMKDLTQYDDLIKDINFYFSQRLAEARSYQIKDLIIDPGFGFAKTRSQNFELLKKLEHLKISDVPILIGLSRKSMIYKTLLTTSDEALNGTTALNTIALIKGANILRVHDVKEALECIKLTQQLNEA
ncbi:MAG: dihydropteroate synthase [Bacteroidia bacterium]|nr:dihydropteroate synthase [Bacteroidia bacterium]MBT8279752.1 dihydropteroate synthase [Bacteroidia bacterium]NNK59246.1 dihydropteroate synthase [Flavobacteriaceae bacterium]NNL32924.1 dihydropteroate synthase [Flavobacteriaceae bacterium]RZW54526.1 MAG: dihydropteroate synthase [Flavobacteriaceae bacterium]